MEQHIAREAVAALAPMGLFSSSASACRRQDHGTIRKQVDEPRAALLEGQRCVRFEGKNGDSKVCCPVDEDDHTRRHASLGPCRYRKEEDEDRNVQSA